MSICQGGDAKGDGHGSFVAYGSHVIRLDEPFGAQRDDQPSGEIHEDVDAGNCEQERGQTHDGRINSEELGDACRNTT